MAEVEFCGVSRRFGDVLALKGLDLAEMSGLPIARFSKIFAPYAEVKAGKLRALRKTHPEKALVGERIAAAQARRDRGSSRGRARPIRLGRP